MYDRLIYVLFAFSGIAGLVYEGTWARYLKLFLGHSSYGQILTLCIYMGGLGIGSFLAAKWIRHIRRPLRAYALTELAIGLSGFLYHFVYVSVTEWFYAAEWSAHLGSGGAEAVKIALAVITTTPVAILLGMTFPFIAAGLMREHQDSGRVSVPLLYFTNSLGAAVGLMLASYLLIPHFGTHGTLNMAAILNLVLAASFWKIDKKTPETHEHNHEAHGSSFEPPKEESLGAMPPTRVWLWVALLTGLTSFIYEVVWIRLLSLMMGSSTHSFDQMVAAFIFGLAVGSLVSRSLLKRDALVMLGLAQVLMGVFALSTVYTHTLFFDFMNASNLIFRETHAGYWGWSGVKLFVSVLWMVPTSFFAGMTLPFLTFIISKATRSETPVGKVYGFNTFGAILGSILAGLILIPALQLKWSLGIAAIVDILIGAALLLFYRPAWRSKVMVWAVLIAFILPIAIVEFDSHMVTSGVFRGHKTYQRWEKVWVANGKTATISFHESPIHQYIKTNGKPDASIRKDRTKPVEGDELTQAATAFIPMATRNQPYDAGMVGFGSGMSAYYLLTDPLLRRLDVVEIEKEMLNLAARFRPINARGIDDPRVNLYVDDARTFFHTHGQKYDVLVSVPSNPWVSGVSSLFSKEFYHHIRRYLKPGGVLVQWLQLYEFDNTLMLHILNALHQSFPYVSLYRIPEEPDIVILASDEPIRQEYIGRFSTNPQIQEEFKRMSRPWYFFGEQNFLATTKSLEHLMAEVQPNSEFIPWVDNKAEGARWAMDEVGLTAAFDSCTLCWPLLLAPEDYKPRKEFKDWLQSSIPPDPYLQESILHHLQIQASFSSFADTVSMERRPNDSTQERATMAGSQPRHLETDAVWHLIWADFKKLIPQAPYSPLRDSIPAFALLRRMVDNQMVPLEISMQFEFDDHLAHGRYGDAVRMLPAFREIFVIATLDASIQRNMALCAFLAHDTREFRKIFNESILRSGNLDNSEKKLIGKLLSQATDSISINTTVDYD